MFFIRVENVSDSDSLGELRSLFERYGPVASVEIVKPSVSLQRGYALVDMPDQRQARTAAAALDGTMFRGRRIATRPIPKRACA
jgi:RNA recognition motif-containing protein